MSGRILKFDASAHRAVEELLPWFVNGTLEGEELALVEQHLRECFRCQHEVESLRELQAAYVGSEMAPDPAQSFQKLRRRLVETRTAARLMPRLPGLRRFCQQALLWAPWAVAAELVAIVVLGALVVSGGEPAAPYRTLGASDAVRRATGTVVVVFDPRITEAELRRIVRATGGRIVDGPTGADAYVLELPAERQAATLEALRAQRAVVLAQRLDRGDTR
jgi:anti-sigma factor RsiW